MTELGLSIHKSQDQLYSITTKNLMFHIQTIHAQRLIHLITLLNLLRPSTKYIFIYFVSQPPAPHAQQFLCKKNIKTPRCPLHLFFRRLKILLNCFSFNDSNVAPWKRHGQDGDKNMKVLRHTFLTIGMLALSGCTVFDSFSEVDALNEAQAIGSPFTQSLAMEYRTFANRELREMFDYPDALHFARKGLAAAAGEVVMPEPVSDWNLEESHIEELSAARGRILIAFDLGAREIAPPEAAYTQAMFDCWIEQQEEDWQSEDILACKESFHESIMKLETMLQPPAEVIEPVVTAAPQEPEPIEPMAPEDAVYLVFFNWDSIEMGSGALNVLDAVAMEIAQNPPSQINIIGHADTSGAKSYNQRLAMKRANNVKDALMQRGVDPNILVADGRGENELLVETPDNVREPANRRVNISFE